MAPDQLPDPVAVALAVASVFERLGIPYFAGGSLASSLHGEPRSTVDVDLVADLRPDHVAPLLAALQSEYYVSEVAVREALRFGTSFNAIHFATAVKVDVYLVAQDPFNAERLAYRQRMQVWADPPAELFVDTAEYTVLRKLEWYRRGGEVSERQWRDVLGVLRVKGDSLDQARLNTWAPRLGVADLLAQAREEAQQR
ncbi:MAG: hypothetical protein HYW06_00230 [Gemmatimonadetes bacterium]|nr:hypothetical protein [Gemmatimonadota bacterium]MBI2402253.1 hypothetical protein [Gemmatimonadota bacterium]MBI2535415.1 hypothetical protein [Gemmatimonadota bacterium]MBI2616285.1 hypothetical protein [Gemmatimonadota bacterium]